MPRQTVRSPAPDLIDPEVYQAQLDYCASQAAAWDRVRKALLSRGIKGRGLHLATSRIGVWTSKAARL